LNVGDRVRLWTGQRAPRTSPKHLFLGERAVTQVLPIAIFLSGRRMGIWVNGLRLSYVERHELARADGFSTVNKMIEWFGRVHGLSKKRPFRGYVIRWSLA
jgi:hypothetical protein